MRLFRQTSRMSRNFSDAVNASQWGVMNFDWANAGDIWQNVHPHNNEELLVKQVRPALLPIDK